MISRGGAIVARVGTDQVVTDNQPPRALLYAGISFLALLGVFSSCALLPFAQK